MEWLILTPVGVPVVGALAAVVVWVRSMGLWAPRGWLPHRAVVPLLAWLIASPAALFAVWGAVVGVAVQPEATETGAVRDGFPRGWDVAMVAVVALCVAVIVLAHRAPLGRRRAAWWMLIAAAPGIAALGWMTVAGAMAGQVVGAACTAVVGVGSVANALLALRVSGPPAFPQPPSPS